MAIVDVFAAKPPRTYGSLLFKNGRWHIAAEPHVLMELKRLFPGYTQTPDGTITLADTLEMAVKVAWVHLMHPLQMAPGVRKRLEGRTQERMDKRATVEAILSGGHLNLGADAYQPSLKLYPHQVTAAALANTTGQLLLLDETGAMKTGSALAAMANPELLPGLIVAPPHLQRQWLAELHRFYPMLRGHIITSGTVYDPARRRSMRGHDPDVLIMQLRDARRLGRPSRREGPDGGRGGGPRDPPQGHAEGESRPTCRAPAPSQKIGLTATPVFNYGDEIYNILDTAIAPGVLGDRREFYAEWCTPVGNGKQKVTDPQALGAHLRELGVVLRRSLKEVGIHLPKLQAVPFEIDVDVDMFDRLTVDAKALAERIVNRTGTHFEQMQAAGEFDMRMRRATGIAKARNVAALCKMLLADPAVGKLILFGWHRSVYEIWLEELADHHPVLYTGSESIPAKEANKTRFVGGEKLNQLRGKYGPLGQPSDFQEADILIVSLRSGAGLDGLQHVSHTVVHGELDWSPAPHDQGDGRLDRPGQTTPVLSYRPYCDYGTDPFMLQKLAEKRQQGEGITQPDGAIFEPSSTDPERIRKVAAAFLRHARQPKQQKHRSELSSSLDADPEDLDIEPVDQHALPGLEVA